MQNSISKVNTEITWASIGNPQEMELLMVIERTANAMQEAMQQFADARDRNTAAQKQLIALRAGCVE